MKEKRINSNWFIWFLFILTRFPIYAQEPKTPNVVLINVDDLGWKDVGYMGSTFYETPHIDQLSREGIVFTNAYASAANCAPSRAGLISGLYGPRHGIYTVKPSARGKSEDRKLIPIETNEILSDTLLTLAKMFKINGYSTGIFGKWHLGADPITHGFDVNVGGGVEGAPGPNGYFSPYNIKNITGGLSGEYLTDRLTKEAINFIHNQRTKPFFVYLSFYTVHTPIQPKAELVPRFKNKNVSLGQDNPEYAAMIYSMDQNIGMLLKTLQDLNLENNTIVIFTSDNGGVRSISYQNPLRAGKGSYYEGGIRVPLIIKWPEVIKEPKHSNQSVINLDIYATLDKIVNHNGIKPKLDGMDLTFILKSEKKIERDLFWHFPIYLESYDSAKDDGKDSIFRTRPGSVIRSGKWKLHEYFEDASIELYNLETDIGEQNNMIHEYPVVAKRLYNKLLEWRLKTKAPAPIHDNPFYEMKELNK